MPNRSPIATFLLIVALLRLVGGDLAVLQVAAWSQMIVTRAPVMGVAEAVTTTFDGAHPCQMCTAIQQTREHENTPDKPKQSAPESPTSLAKLLLVEADETKIPAPFQDEFSLTKNQWTLPTLHGQGNGQPPTPPPRDTLA
ncbi:hypothetical protein FEM03_18835 [Phragmitibacter flavus]|uniref:Uncharacterized protein n=1 Tax=Phragmitibacter flavus TaxID=2576071 RepID=A0A5R8KA58_9BACT|nr:hypothetical protein [Phragmitibacter flavus]TLD69157.1 hypothetical protein FEM03_18835 [Phragmitibacter flavus]